MIAKLVIAMLGTLCILQTPFPDGCTIKPELPSLLDATTLQVYFSLRRRIANVSVHCVVKLHG